MDLHILDDQLNREIVTLLLASNLSPVEKKLWVEVLSHMTKEEKDTLKKNLEKELEYEQKVMEKSLAELTAAMEKEFSTSTKV